jgi:endonuclease/exonuclease/phosphatase family metal-dependent hydrolase
MKKSLLLSGGALCICVVVGGYLYARNQHEPFSQTEEVTTSPVTSKACPYLFVSWNLENFGEKKSEEAIEVIAQVLRDADIVALQEVTAGKLFGARAVTKLSSTMSRKGADFDYLISSPTVPASPGVERYAFLFKKSTITTNNDKAHLVYELEEAIDREPYAAEFTLKHGGTIMAYTIHTVPTAKDPVKEVEALPQSKELQGANVAIFSSDFNLGKRATDPTFKQLGFTGYISELTSLKMKVSSGRYLTKQYDNIYGKGIHVCSSGTINFVEKFFSPVTDESLKKAREVSDHLPVFITFDVQ